MDKRQVAKIEENLMIDNTLKIVWSDFYVNICITYPIFRYNLLYVPYETKLISVVFLTEISQINCCMSLKRVQLDLNQRILILQTSALPDFAMYSYINDRTITQ